MPPPPDTSLFTRYLLENPWPVAVILAACGAVVLWTGLREGLVSRTRLGGGLIAIGVAAAVIGWLVVTPAEHAKRTVRGLADLVASNQVGADEFFAPNVSMAFASPTNPGYDMDFILDRLNRLTQAYRIESNTITMLRGYSESDDSGLVYLGCLTSVSQFPGYSASQWIIRVQRQADGQWKITRLTWMSINGQKPAPGTF